MKFGVHVFPTEYSIQPDELARAAEERGLDSVWFSEHTHIPVSFLKNPVGRSALPDFYWQTYDIFVAMTMAAMATQSIKIASGISLIIEHHPINLAKAAATLDQVSRGRFIFGIGAGWLESEMADHGVAYPKRFKLLKEQVQAMQEIWTTEESEFHGSFVGFDKMKEYPKPYQQPHPPIIMGGEGAKAIECAAELCDGWAPWQLEWPQAREAIAELRRQARANGRDPDKLESSVFEKNIPDQATRAEMQASGIQRIILTIYGQGREEALPRLDELARLVE